MTIGEYFFLAAALLYNAFFFYYLVLAVAGLWPVSTGKKKSIAQYSPDISFLILVPAHNEESVISRTLDNLKQLDYPEHLYEIVVIADNCSDDTAQKAKNAGIRCLERTEPANPGKGQALHWALDRLLPASKAQAVVVIDADTLADANLLKVFAWYLDKGSFALQARYNVLNPENSVMSSFAFFGFAVSQNLKYRGRSRLGLSANLLGNGMCFAKTVLERFPWQAFSISEDLEYQLQLNLAGMRVTFAAETEVRSEMPAGIRSLKQQRSRWDMGKYRLRNQYAPLLLRKLAREGKPLYLDTFLELIIPPYTLFAGTSFLLFALDLLCLSRQQDLRLYLWIFLNGGLVAYTTAGLLAARTPPNVLVNLIFTPFFLLLKAGIAFQSIFTKGTRWIKTERN